MNILPHKSWHVYNRENVAQVKRDEAQAAEEQARIDERADSADREYRLQVLRDRAKRQYSNAVVDVARDNVVHDEDMRKEPDTTIEILQEKSERAAITQKQHINFWPDLENTTKSVANQTFKKTPKEHEKQRLAGYDKKGQMGEPLGSVVKGPAPWYQQPNAGVMTASEQKGQEHQSSKLREDPLQMVNSMLGKKKEMTEKRRGTSPVKLNKKIRLSEHKVLGTRVDSPDEVKNGMSMMVKLRMERMEREREEHRKARALYAPTREDSEDGSFYNQQFNPEATKIAHRHTLYSSSTNTRSGAKEYDPQNDRKQSREQNDGRHRDHDQSQGRISGHGDRKERDEGRDRDRDKSRNSSSKHRDDHRDEHRVSRDRGRDRKDDSEEGARRKHGDSDRVSDRQRSSHINDDAKDSYGDRDHSTSRAHRKSGRNDRPSDKSSKSSSLHHHHHRRHHHHQHHNDNKEDDHSAASSRHRDRR